MQDPWTTHTCIVALLPWDKPRLNCDPQNPRISGIYIKTAHLLVSRITKKMANKKKPYFKKSVNSELNPHLKQSHASGSEQSLRDSLIEYNQPESSYISCHFTATSFSRD
jgi:hypothetical protein